MTATALCSPRDGSSNAESIYDSIREAVFKLWQADDALPGQLSGRWSCKEDAKAKLIPLIRQVLLKALRQQNPAWECDLDFDRDHIPDGLLLANRYAAKRIEIQLKERAIKIGGEWLPLGMSGSGDQIVKVIVEQVARFFSTAPSTDQSPFRLPRPSTRVGRF